MDHLQPKSLDTVPLPWWLTECLFWLGFSLTEFVWLDLFYGNDPTVLTIARVLAEAAMGAVFARPILWGASWLQRFDLLPRLVLLVLTVVIVSQLWNVARMFVYPVFFPGAYIWNQYGGWAFSAVAIFSLWTTLYFSVRAYKLAAYQREVANREHIERLHAEKQSSNATLKMLRYQINPHFIFNTLNSISALIATNQSQDARVMIGGLSDLLRKTLEQDSPMVVPVAEELDTAERYLRVEKMRFGERLVIDIKVDDDAKNLLVPSLILQPLVENAVRHGVEAQSQPCLIAIEARLVNDRLQITVTDTGPGLRGDSGTRGTGLGVENVRARLASTYGDEASFSLSAHDGPGMHACIDIPQVVRDFLQ
jgi:two-component system LytT family sensor kinase